MDEERSALRRSFGAAAAAYARHRPDYAQDAVRWALERAPGRRVLDLGAGTGKLTAVLGSVGVQVTAVEPDGAMLAELRRELPSVRPLEGSAEAIPVPDASVDALLAGHSLHWFDMDVAGPEIARVLVPGGTLAGLWNVLDDRIAWIAELAAVAGPAAVGPRDTLTRWRTATSGACLPASGISHLFDRPEQAEFPHAQRRTVDSLVEALATRAGFLVMSEPERAATLDRIRAFLVGRAETVGEFELPMMTGVLRVRRGDQGVLEQAQAPGCCPPRPFRSVAMLRPWRSRGSGLLTGRRSGQCGSPPCPTRRRPSVPPTPTG